MNKVMVIEFDDNVSLEEMKEEMEFYRKNNQVVMTIIGGIEVFSDDPKFEEIFERLLLNLTKEEYYEVKNLERENICLGSSMFSLVDIEEKSHIRFYFGLVKTMIRQEKIAKFEEEMIYYCSLNVEVLVIAAKIMLALEQENKLQIYREINEIICTLKLHSHDEQQIDRLICFDSAVKLVKEYGNKGELVDEIFFKGTTSDYVDNIKERIGINVKKIEQIKGRKK